MCRLQNQNFYKNLCDDSMNNKISSGLRELDEIIGGGYYPGYVVLIAGNPGVGKTTFAATFLYHGLKSGEAGLYISFCENKEEFYRHMKALGMDFRAYEKKGLFKFIDAVTFINKQSVDELVKVIAKNVYTLKAKRVVIDSITALYNVLKKEVSRAFLHSTLFSLFKPLGVVVYLIAELPLGVQVIGHGHEEFLADVVFKLIMEEKQGMIRRKLVLHKVRESPITKHEYEFIIMNNGIRIYVPPSLRLGGSYDIENRISTGISGLDEMLGGGIPRRSTVLIAGPNGAGKTILLLSIAANAANKGLKIIFRSINEPEKQILSSLKTLGYKIKDIKENTSIGDILVNNNLSIKSITPGTINAVVLYNNYVKVVEEYKPDLIIIDGLDLLEREYGTEFYRYIGDVLVYAKKSGTAFIASICDDNGVAVRNSILASLADIILRLWFITSGNRLTRRIAVLKMRGFHPSTRIKELVIDKKGVVVV